MIEKSKQVVKGSPGSTAVKRQTSDLRQRWGWTEESIWTENMLVALENGVKGGKWFSLIDKVYDLRTLKAAWKKVRANKGAAGIDDISVGMFERKAEVYLLEIQQALKSNYFRPLPVKRAYISKGKGKLRPLGIPVVKDRIVQSAIKLVIEPIFEKEFSQASYGFRPGRSCKDALRVVDGLLVEGCSWYVDADIQGYFDAIPHDRLMQKFKRYISDGTLCELVESFVRHDVMEDGGICSALSGTPQGGIISPLLANLYLHDLDLMMEKEGFRMVRFADDFIVLASDEQSVIRAQTFIHEWVEENQLTVHPDKSHTGNSQIKGQGFEFLGYRFENGKRWVREKSILNLRNAVRDRTKRAGGVSIAAVIQKLNPVLRGWYNYFKHVNLYGMNTFDAFVRRRLRAILRHYNKRPGFGRSLRDHQSWPNSYFANLGLFTMESERKLELARESRC